MSNMIDYLKWRGDIPFSLMPFNDVDNLIFTQLCFVDFSNIVSEDPKEKISLHMASRKALARLGPKSKKLGMMIPDEILNLLQLAAISPRYRDIELCGAISFTDTDIETQFSAITAILTDNEAVITFRGTDDSIIGWKEDFNMSLLPNIPSQKLSVEYVKDINCAYPEKNLYISGHSKGGNLSIYSAVNSPDTVKDKIIRVYNNDGPGFKAEFFKSAEYNSVKNKIKTVVPQSSFVGLMFEQDPDTLNVVKSTKAGPFQHDVFSWQVTGPSIEEATLSKETLKGKKAFNNWIDSMDYEDRKDAINTIFDFLMSYDATTLTEAFNNSPKLIRSYRELPEEKRKIVATAFKIFFHQRIKNAIEPITPLFKNFGVLGQKQKKEESKENTEEEENNKTEPKT